MIIRAQIRLRALVFVFLFAAMTLTGAFAPALAKTPYRMTSDCEGDPGDGVLDPAADRGDSGGTDPRGQEVTETASFVTGWSGDVLPFFVPDAGTGRLTVVLIPRGAWLGAFGGLDRYGRFHDAP